MFQKKLLAFATVVASAVFGAGMASATGTAIDVSAVTDQIAAAIAPIGEIGGGVLLVLVAVKAYKWVRRAM